MTPGEWLDFCQVFHYIYIMDNRVIPSHFAVIVNLSKQRIHQLIPRLRHKGPQVIRGYKVEVEDIETHGGRVKTYINILESPSSEAQK